MNFFNIHVSVLTNEVINYLNPKPNENFIDGTFDGGGHTEVLFQKNGPNGKILGIDADKEILNIATSKFQKEIQEKRLILVNDNFKNLKGIIENNCPGWKEKVSGIIFDLGISLWHLEESGRGFSFKKNENLDMRYDISKEQRGEGKELTAKEIVNTWSEEEIEKILREYGEERYSRKIAGEIIGERKKKAILTTFDLINIVRKAVPRYYKKGYIHPATRTFQALRIAVNRELENLKEVLPQSIEILKPKGKLIVVSFHSLEDRIVKFFFKKETQNNRIKILTKKPVRSSDEELKFNPRARSAKLRAAIKI